MRRGEAIETERLESAINTERISNQREYKRENNGGQEEEGKIEGRQVKEKEG